MSRWRWSVILALSGFLYAAHPPVRLFTAEDGLVRNWIKRIHRDSRGYLWFCTVEGLSIFDGSHFTNFTTRDGLPSRIVNDVLETHDGEYWIATGDGLSRFYPVARKNGGHFENFRVGSSEDANRVGVLFEDSARNVWCGTDAGLYRLNRSTSEVRIEPVALERGRFPEIRVLAEDPAHRLWAGGDGVYVRRPDGSIFRLPDRDLPGGAKSILMEEKRVWIGGEGLVGLSLDTDPPVMTAHYRNWNGQPLLALALHLHAAGEIWIGGHGLTRFRPDAPIESRFQPFRTLSIIEQHYVGDLTTDAEGNLWATISNLGAARIARTHSELFSERDGLESAVVHGLTESRTGVVYAITGERHTLNEFNGDRFQPRPAKLPPALSYMGWGEAEVALQSRDGRWWIASGSGALCYPPGDDARRLENASPRLYTANDGLPHSIVLRLFEDSQGGIWAGTADGAGRFDRSSERWASYGALNITTGEMRGAVHAIAEDGNGAIWLGFASPRLLRVRGSQVDVFTKGLAGFINALLVDHAGRLWIGSSQGGLYRVDDPAAPQLRLRAYTIDQGLGSNHVFSLAEDSFGHIYIAGGRGVDRLDAETGAIRHFTAGDGLPPGETERLYRDRKGFIWFASNFGLARYQPEPDQRAAPSQPLLRSINIGGVLRPVSVVGERSIEGLELAPGQNNLELEYRALDFAAGERLRYQYRLRGASEQWSAPTDLQTVQYARLSPGRYRFEVRSVAAGVASAPASFDFQLLAPFWQRWWFVTAVILFSAAAGYAFHRYRLAHFLALERVRTRLAMDLHDDLGAGLAEIAILAEVARRKPQDGAGEVLDYVARHARRLRAALGDIVWTVDPRRDRLSDLVDRMRETALTVLQNDRCTVAFSTPAEEQLQKLEVAPEMRRHLLLFFKEAIINVARHADATNVLIEIAPAGRSVHLLIRDNGRGFDPHPHDNDKDNRVGNGLMDLRRRAAEMRGELRLRTAPERGVEIELDVPLKSG